MLELTVFLSGALVMVLEMVGGRVLAPHVGTSAVVWTSLIGVVLACLALGAWAGGRFADKKLSRRGLGQALAGAGLGCALTAFCHTALGAGATRAVGNLYLAAVAAALGIFALPAFFFGMITPYVIRLRIADVDTAGATVGWLYALSTAGSILGTFLGGFVLIWPSACCCFPSATPRPGPGRAFCCWPSAPCWPGRTGFTGNGWRKRAACAWWKARTTASGSWKAWTAPGTAGPCA